MVGVAIAYPLRNFLDRAMGKAAQSFILNISRQGIFFIPVILILPHYFGLNGVLFTQTVADFLTSLLTLYFAVRVRRIVIASSRRETHNFN